MYMYIDKFSLVSNSSTYFHPSFDSYCTKIGMGRRNIVVCQILNIMGRSRTKSGLDYSPCLWARTQTWKHFFIPERVFCQLDHSAYMYM